MSHEKHSHVRGSHTLRAIGLATVHVQVPPIHECHLSYYGACKMANCDCESTKPSCRSGYPHEETHLLRPPQTHTSELQKILTKCHQLQKQWHIQPPQATRAGSFYMCARSQCQTIESHVVLTASLSPAANSLPLQCTRNSYFLGVASGSVLMTFVWVVPRHRHARRTQLRDLDFDRRRERSTSLCFRLWRRKTSFNAISSTELL